MLGCKCVSQERENLPRRDSFFFPPPRHECSSAKWVVCRCTELSAFFLSRGQPRVWGPMMKRRPTSEASGCRVIAGGRKRLLFGLGKPKGGRRERQQLESGFGQCTNWWRGCCCYLVRWLGKCTARPTDRLSGLGPPAFFVHRRRSGLRSPVKDESSPEKNELLVDQKNLHEGWQGRRPRGGTLTHSSSCWHSLRAKVSWAHETVRRERYQHGREGHSWSSSSPLR